MQLYSYNTLELIVLRNHYQEHYEYHIFLLDLLLNNYEQNSLPIQRHIFNF